MYQNKQGQPRSANVRTQNLKLNSRSVSQTSSRPFETTFSPIVSPSDGFCSATLDNNSYDLYGSGSSLYNDQMLWESAFEVPEIKLESEPISNELPNLVKDELADDVLVNTSWQNEPLGREIKEEIEESGETKNVESGQNRFAQGLVAAQAYKEHIRAMTNTNVNILCEPSSKDESKVLDRFKCNRVNSLDTSQSTEAISAIDLSSKPQVVDNSMKLNFINGSRQPNNTECLVNSNINNMVAEGNSTPRSPTSDSTQPYNLELCNMALKIAQCVSVCLTEESSKEIIVDRTDNDAVDVYDTNAVLLRTSPGINLLSNRKKNKKAMQLEKQKVKHPLRERCNCREFVTKCSSITDSQMVCIHNEFWQSDLAGRRSFYEAMVVSKEVKRRRRDTDKTKVVKGETCESENKRLRTVTHLYHLPLSVNEGPVMVCKRMFLATLGLTNSSSLVSFLRAKAKDPKSRNYLSESRGGDRKSDSDKLKAMIDHINSYNPITLECCRRNGNNIRYLPKDLTVLSMFTDFKRKYPDYKVCVETYRRVVKTVNVLTRVPYSVACEFCIKQKNDDNNSLEELGTA